ncbi:hypothetical protein [Mycobacteroides abscessus]|uniref:hypothetical protein n=1 Tax=Mycobacteroides abscessus TaxID=36809 RepID=UPI000C26768C|nr:hypothetical protein [Mycobacteroides abscessus]
MKIDLSDLVPATDLTRQTGRLITEVAAGGRKVILYNGIPSAALIGLEDFQRLADYDTAPGKAPTAAQLVGDGPVNVETAGLRIPAGSTAPEGHAPVGISADDHVVALPIDSHYLFIGDDQDDLAALQSAALLGATRTGPDRVRIALATPRPIHRFTESHPQIPHVITSACNLELSEPADRLTAQLRGEIARRKALLREHSAGSIPKLRQKAPDLAAQIPDLIVAVDYADEILIAPPSNRRPVNNELAREIAHLFEPNDIGIYAWLFASRSPWKNSDALPARVVTRIAAARARRHLGSDAAHGLAAGQAMLVRDGAKTLRFTITEPAAPDYKDVAVPVWPELPESVDLDSVISQFQATEPEAGSEEIPTYLIPIGLLDAPHEHSLPPLTVNLRRHVWLYDTSIGAQNRILDVLIASATRLYPDMQVYTAGPDVAEHHKIERKAHTTKEIETLLQTLLAQRINGVADSENASKPPILLIVRVSKMVLNSDIEFLLGTLLAQGHRSGIYLVVSSPTNGRNHSQGIAFSSANPGRIKSNGTGVLATVNTEPRAADCGRPS